MSAVVQLAEKLRKIIQRYDELTEQLLTPDNTTDFAKLAKERAELEELTELARQYLRNLSAIQEADQIIAAHDAEDDLKTLAMEDKEQAAQAIPDLENKIKVLLLPKDADDEKGAIIEVRAGSGGEEAALFAAVLFHMYRKYAERKKWKFEILSLSETGLDGYKEATACISGKGVFRRLKFESGVHRVQRVPVTESSGRIHTSAATVAVLPEVEQVDINIQEKDLRIDVYRASGAGGQHVNTTDSAVRITHIPTNTIVTVQDEKSQHQNKAKALKILSARLYELEHAAKASERSAMRKGQVGSGDRSERIRTYNYPQSRITDHRINLTSHAFTEIVNEGDLDRLVEPLLTDYIASQLAAIEG